MASVDSVVPIFLSGLVVVLLVIERLYKAGGDLLRENLRAFSFLDDCVNGRSFVLLDRAQEGYVFCADQGHRSVQTSHSEAE
jgi:hypothetical protein